jgi:hypothetical protein
MSFSVDNKANNDNSSQRSSWSKFNVIVTFEKHDQEIYNVIVPHDISEDMFLLTIFNLLNSYGEQYVSDLIKISCCLMWNKSEVESLYFPWLLKRNGKFYFNTITNPDPDTVHLSHFKDKFIHQLQ